MIEFSTSQITAWVMSFFWPFVRILAFVGAAPIFGSLSVPRRVKICIGALLAALIAPTLGPMPDVPPFSPAGMLLIVQQVLIGAAIGFTMRVSFSVIQAAGAFIGRHMGLGFSTFYSPALGSKTVVMARILNVFAILMFLALNGHLIMIQILASSFDTVPVGVVGINASVGMVIARWGGTVISAGLIMSLPLIAILLTAQMAMGILNRASPQLTIFSIGLPLTLLTGTSVLMFMAPALEQIYTNLFESGFQAMMTVIQAMTGTGG